MKILVTGGAGYIGSHMVQMLITEGHQVVTLDNLSNGFRDAVLGGEFEEIDLRHREELDKFFDRAEIDAVLHFASLIEVGESVEKPDKYYKNNLIGSLNLIDAMINHGIKKFIFSSTAAIFGEPKYIPIDEPHPTDPVNPYGQCKLIIEKILADYDRAFDFKSVSLRYFNAAGADPEARLGERHNPETHLIPLVLMAASGRRDKINIFGHDYDTPDGTCVRDYIHIVDLCRAHLLALEMVDTREKSGAYNLGNGNGFSVQDVIDTAERVTGRKIKTNDSPRREGDPSHLVADSKLAREELGWKPEYTDLVTIIEHAWNWERKIVK